MMDYTSPKVVPRTAVGGYYEAVVIVIWTKVLIVVVVKRVRFHVYFKSTAVGFADQSGVSKKERR